MSLRDVFELIFEIWDAQSARLRRLRGETNGLTFNNGRGVIGPVTVAGEIVFDLYTQLEFAFQQVTLVHEQNEGSTEE